MLLNIKTTLFSSMKHLDLGGPLCVFFLFFLSIYFICENDLATIKLDGPMTFSVFDDVFGLREETPFCPLTPLLCLVFIGQKK